eukprot:2360737-Rhodomonas_salina.2
MADRSGPIPDGKELSSSLLAQQAAAAAVCVCFLGVRESVCQCELARERERDREKATARREGVKLRHGCPRRIEEPIGETTLRASCSNMMGARQVARSFMFCADDARS